MLEPQPCNDIDLSPLVGRLRRWELPASIRETSQGTSLVLDEGWKHYRCAVEAGREWAASAEDCNALLDVIGNRGLMFFIPWNSDYVGPPRFYANKPGELLWCLLVGKYGVDGSVVPDLLTAGEKASAEAFGEQYVGHRTYLSDTPLWCIGFVVGARDAWWQAVARV